MCDTNVHVKDKTKDGGDGTSTATNNTHGVRVFNKDIIIHCVKVLSYHPLSSYGKPSRVSCKMFMCHAFFVCGNKQTQVLILTASGGTTGSWAVHAVGATWSSSARPFPRDSNQFAAISPFLLNPRQNPTLFNVSHTDAQHRAGRRPGPQVPFPLSPVRHLSSHRYTWIVQPPILSKTLFLGHHHRTPPTARDRARL